MAQSPPLRSPIMGLDGKLTDPWERYFSKVVTPYFERIEIVEQEQIFPPSDPPQGDPGRTEIAKLLSEIWQTGDKGFNQYLINRIQNIENALQFVDGPDKRFIKRIEDLENALQFIDGPKDASLLKRLDDLEMSILGFPRVIERSPGSHIADASTAHAITDPADAPGTADILRDDLVANAVPEIESALDALGTKVNEILTRMEEQAQNHSG